MLLEEGSAESIPVLRRRRSDGGAGEGVVKNPDEGWERKREIWDSDKWVRVKKCNLYVEEGICLGAEGVFF